MSNDDSTTAPPSRRITPDAGRLMVVGIGTSAGGLDAAIRLLEALPRETGMAFILIQHLDPTQKSMMVELLVRHSAMTILQAADGMPVQADHLYVIPPGVYLSVAADGLHLSTPPERHGARLPFDFLLQSMAETYGARSACVVLSGTGGDGSAGLLAIKIAGGLVLVQEPQEAGYDGMPQSAIATGEADAVLPITGIADALAAHQAKAGAVARTDNVTDAKDRWLQEIIELLRARTAHDFTPYKPGTLQRRIERRMAMASFRFGDIEGYRRRLDGDQEELELLAQDLLINVTEFFRDPAVFEHLAATTIPALIEAQPAGRPLRIWVAGCSTGEETYSLAMVLIERIEAAGKPVKLQLFASDVDADAVAAARDALYTDASVAAIAPARLSRFFAREGAFWRASSDLRNLVIFAVQDILADPPFSRLDMVSCRNLLIYLRPEAQARVMKLFHFALREDGILLLGNAENAAESDGLFIAVSKPERIFRRVGRTRASENGPPGRARPRDADEVLARPPPPSARPAVRPAALADLGRRLVSEFYAPASILINAKNEVLFAIGPTDRYLHLPAGHATLDVLAMARPGLRSKLRTSLRSAREGRVKVSIDADFGASGEHSSCRLDVRPVLEAGDNILLVCFVDLPPPTVSASSPAAPPERVTELERELEATRRDLQGSVKDLETSVEDQRAINEEAQSVNEEYLSTNEELLASKEELQSLNEELTALNSQLQETLERERTTSNDLQNVLYSTNVATLFLDRDLRIRFFTPATKALFAVVPTDIGRKLADLAALAPDGALEPEARAVLSGLESSEREIETGDGVWFRRRILPYRSHDGGIEGVVITFTEITTRKRLAKALEAAKLQAETANAAKSRFLAAASHDLRQPLQTLALLQALLAKSVESDKSKQLVARLDDTLGTMRSMLDTLLDINQIEAGIVLPTISPIAISPLLVRLHEEFVYQARSKQLTLRIVPCSLLVSSDSALLEQMLRNLISNAVKYTERGGILLGCRRRGTTVSVEVWDSGIGIAETEQNSIFEEYHQIDNPARERSRGLGLGLSIVKRLGELLGHRVKVQSRRGKGSCFAIEVPRARVPEPLAGVTAQPASGEQPRSRKATILVVEDDPDLRDFLQQLLEGEGHHVVTAPTGAAALAQIARVKPDLMLADYNLPGGPNGLDLADLIRDRTARDLPVVILTGDISTETAHAVSRHRCVQLNKPVRPTELVHMIETLLAARARAAEPAQAAAPAPPSVPPSIIVIDDDDALREVLIAVIADAGWTGTGFASAEAFLAAAPADDAACLLIDAALPGMDGLSLFERLRASGSRLPAIMITGGSDVSMAVRAMKAGAFDFIEKPVQSADLLASIGRALEQSLDSTKRAIWQKDAAARVGTLTSRQRQIMNMVLAGQPSKNIAADLGISQRTVENHRASVMHKTGSASVPALVRLALASSFPTE